MGDSLIPLLIIWPTALAGLVTVALASMTLRWSKKTVALVAAFPAPLGILGVGSFALAHLASQPVDPDAIDAGSMTFAATIVMTPLYAAFAFASGWLTARTCLRVLKI